MKFPVYYYVWNYVQAGLVGLAILIALVLIMRQSAKNDAEPIRTVPVKLAKKREEYVSSLRGYGYSYSILFLTDSDEILEIHMPTKFDWDMLNEGDRGNLTYQGTRYIKFERTHINPPT